MIEIIPAIDIIDGKCVRLTEGDYTRKTVYSDSPPACHLNVLRKKRHLLTIFPALKSVSVLCLLFLPLI